MPPINVPRGRLRAMYTAAVTLGNRRLPTLNSDLRCARIVRSLGDIVEPINATRAKIPLRVLGDAKVEELSAVHLQMLSLQIAAEQQAFDGELEEVSLPATVLTQADLPKEQSGDEGWKNASQVAVLAADLYELFTLPEE